MKVQAGRGRRRMSFLPRRSQRREGGGHGEDGAKGGAGELQRAALDFLGTHEIHHWMMAALGGG